MTDEARSWNELQQENARLRNDNASLLTQVAQMRQTIANYEQAMKVSGQVDGSPHLKSVGLRTRAYQRKP